MNYLRISSSIQMIHTKSALLDEVCLPSTANIVYFSQDILVTTDNDPHVVRNPVITDRHALYAQ